MLQLIDVTKDYKTPGQTVRALKGVNLRFRKNEFVAVLGASGCGKTTLLNIIGGLDHYTSGDLIINGKSTKKYADRDWDVYRNHRVGFVFQSYNLIPQQTILGNVEIALTIAGISKSERRRRAEEALRRVGLENEMKKRPNQLSGGQMQRVAIARALVNNPEILLADEPTGALDTETSIQIMDLIREIAGERLVIMVTHNPELAEEYANRIVRLQDGLVLSDSNPYTGEEEGTVSAVNEQTEEITPTPEAPVLKKKGGKKEKKERSSMSFTTSLGLSARNLLMKKGRTAVTSIAGSIGIISVCLVLALSNGFNGYIKKTQEDMLSSSPLQITETTMDMEAIMTGMTSASQMPDLSKLDDKVYVNSFLTSIAQGMTVTNDLSVEYQDYVRSMDENIYEAITMDTGLKFNDALYTEVTLGEDEQAVMSLAKLKEYYVAKIAAIDGQYSQLVPLVDFLGAIYGKMPGTSARDVQSGRYGNYILSQYDVIEGRFPSKEGASDEAVLVVGPNNDMTDLTLAQLGFMKEDDFVKLFEKNEEVKVEQLIDFSNIVGKKYRLNYNDYIYTPAASGEYAYTKASGERTVLEEGEGRTVTITGILRVREGMNYGCLGNGGLYFTEQLYDEVLAENAQSEIAKTMKAQESKSKEFFAVMQALSAIDQTDPSSAGTVQVLSEQMMKILNDNQDLFRLRAEKSMDTAYLAGASWAKDNPALGAMLNGCYFVSDTTLMRTIGAKDNVNSISIYTGTFEDKDAVIAHLDRWNDTHETEQQVKYTDSVGMMLSMVETILNAITYVLVAFTAISLIVSSVMIGIITYVSVVERVKEIGVLRSLGARKRDIKNLFNAETFIIGLTSGVFGVAVTYLLSLAVNGILGTLTGITTLASLPFSSALIMIAISICLTLISGLIPANAAAKKDPVVALRTE